MRLKPNEIKPNPDNPRFIKDDNFRKLVQSIKDFPEMADIRPVVVNKDHMILGGNMRYKAMVEAGWTEIPVQVVDLPKDKEREFIIKDNLSGGDWDWDVLANDWDQELLEQWGLETDINNKIDSANDGEFIEFEQSVQIEPPQEYILIKAEPNSIEWEELKEKLQLKMVKRGGYKKGSPFEAVSIERVLDWTDFKDRIGL